MENPSFKEKKLYTNTLFASNFVLAMVVSARVLERQFQGLFKPGPKSCTKISKIRANQAQNTSFSFIAKFRGHFRQVQQVKLVKKKQTRTAPLKKLHIQKRTGFFKTNPHIYRLQGNPKIVQFNSSQFPPWVKSPI